VTRAAAIDIGSNAVRMTIAERRKGGGFRVLRMDRASIRLGHDVFSTGRISERAAADLARALAGFARQIRSQRVRIVRAVATSALREASNRQAVLKRISRALGHPVEAISGLEEGELIRRAVQEKLDLAREPSSLLVELGGGSAEVTLLVRGQPQFAECLKVGAVRLLEILDSRNNGRFDRLVQGHCQRIVDRLKQHLPLKHVGLLVGTGGNIEEIARLGKGKRLPRGAGLKLKAGNLAKVAARLARHSVAERVERLGLRPDRADVILPASLFYQQMLRSLRMDSILVPFASLREGMLLELFSSQLPGEADFSLRQRVLEEAVPYAARWRVDSGHSAQVRRLALELFDGLASLHKLDNRQRLLLELAAWFHDSGYYISSGAHHKHSQYLVRQMDLPGLSRKEVEMAAMVARYHRRAFPKPSHSDYSSLTGRDRQVVWRLGGMLRLADVLDREHQSKVQGLRLWVGKKDLEITCLSRRELFLDSAEVKEKSRLFEKAFGRRVVLRAEKPRLAGSLVLQRFGVRN
jgi:exopolyphosphatase/guanosine-5'-triphosphate,3'-diphosphate pyrophosphatase